MELYRKYRPRKLSEIVGQDDTIQVLKTHFVKGTLPHAMLFSGPSGVGKTTIARITATKVGTVGKDMKEINAGDKGGIDTIRNLSDIINASPMYGGRSRTFIIDECHELTRPAQENLNKVLEECPEWAYVILCTTDPQDLLKTIKTRCTPFDLKSVSQEDLCKVVVSVVEKEIGGKDYPPDEVVEKIAELAEGSPRMALTLLGKVIYLESASEQMEILQKTETKKQAIDLARAIIKPKPRWSEVKEIIKRIEEDPEKVRRILLNYIAAVCVGGGPLAKRTLHIYNVFRDMFYGKYDLTFAAYACCEG